MRAILACALVSLIAGCTAPAMPQVPPGEPSSVKPGPASHDPESSFQREAESFYAADMAFHPARAARLGHHRYDGIVPDRSHSAITAELARLRRAAQVLEAIPAGKLSPRSRLERAVILRHIRAERFQLAVVGAPFHNPLYYLKALELTGYLSRRYATLAQRAHAVVRICNGAPKYINEAEVNLPESMARPAVDSALLRVRGMIAAAEREIPAAVKPIDGTPLSRLVDRGVGNYVMALGGFEQFLAARRKRATEHFTLGAAKFLQMLADTQGVTTSLAHLEAIARADLARNTTALRDVARKIAPTKTLGEVVAAVASDRPKPGRALALARRQASEMRAFVIAHNIASIPTNDVAAVRASPPSLRWKAVSFSAAGPFETTELPSFLYISPPHRSRAATGRREALSKEALLSSAVADLWPGRFLHSLHDKVNRSPILKSYCTDSTDAGWAEYAEQMMFEAGVRAGHPRYRAGQLARALLDDARLLAAIGLRAGNLTIARATKLIEDKAFTDRATARREAMRATFDPDAVDGALGKLMILKLRADWKRKVGSGYSVRDFNDTFLSYGCAPIPVIRRAMLGKHPGPPL